MQTLKMHASQYMGVLVGLWTKYALHKEILFNNNQLSNTRPISIPRSHHILKENKNQITTTNKGVKSNVKSSLRVCLKTIYLIFCWKYNRKKLKEKKKKKKKSHVRPKRPVTGACIKKVNQK